MTRHHRTLIGVGLLAVAVAAPAAFAASDQTNTYATTITNARADIGGLAGDDTAYVRARLSFPDELKTVKRTDGTRTLRRSSPGCTYTIKVRTRVIVTGDSSAQQRVLAARPAKGPYLLDAGQRGLTAWRVTRIADQDHVDLRATRVSPLVAAGRQLDLADDLTAWQEVLITATSRPGDECHTGTYRDALGPQIGDTLATARTVGYTNR